MYVFTMSLCEASYANSGWLDSYPSLRDPASIVMWFVSECQRCNGNYGSPQQILNTTQAWKYINQHGSYSRVTTWKHALLQYHLYLLDHVEHSNLKCIWKIGFRDSSSDMEIQYHQTCPNKHALPISGDIFPLLMYHEDVTNNDVVRVKKKSEMTSNQMLQHHQMFEAQEKKIAELEDELNRTRENQSCADDKRQGAEKNVHEQVRRSNVEQAVTIKILKKHLYNAQLESELLRAGSNQTGNQSDTESSQQMKSQTSGMPAAKLGLDSSWRILWSCIGGVIVFVISAVTFALCFVHHKRQWEIRRLRTILNFSRPDPAGCHGQFNHSVSLQLEREESNDNQEHSKSTAR